ncbi:hypothetical protein AOLI_G00252700 [Acnodon oligacanthus]
MDTEPGPGPGPGPGTSFSFLPPIKGSKPPVQPMKDNWMENSLGVHDAPPPPSAVQRERTPEVTLDALFSARLLGNETPEPEHEQVSSEDEEETLSGYPKDLKVLSFFKKTAEELVRWLESTFHLGFPGSILYENLVDCLLEEVEMLAVVNITFEAHDEVDAISYIVSEVHDDLLKQPWRMEVSCVNEGTIGYISYTAIRAFINYTTSWCKEARTSPDTDLDEGSQGEPEMQEICSTVLSQRSSSERADLIRELGGSPYSTDLSDDECSEILTSFQSYSSSQVKRPISSIMSDVESTLEAWSDSSSSIPAVQVTEVENIEDLEVPACSNGTTDSTTTGTKKWKKLRTRVSRFVRRVFCFGCLPSRHVVPL